MNRIQRLLQHLTTGTLTRRRWFPDAALASITGAIRVCESRHAGEIRFAIEPALGAAAIWAGVTPRARAIEVFSQLRVWDTAHNNGVLIYVLLADRSVEIVADRGVAGGLVDQQDWDRACRLMEAQFAKGEHALGAVAGIEAVADVLAKHPPGEPDVGNEMPDEPVLLR